MFHVNYLGGDMPTFTLNFSRPGNQLIGQYYNFLRLGRSGYRKVMESLRDMAVHASGRVAALGPFELISDGSAIPVFSFRLETPRPTPSSTSPSGYGPRAGRYPPTPCPRPPPTRRSCAW